MNPPPILNTPPPRDPAGMAGLFESRVPLGIKMLVGIWGFVLALVGLMTLRGYLKYGEVDVAVAGVIGGVVGVALSAAVVIGLVLAQGRATRLYTHGLGAMGRVRSVTPGQQADHAASIELDFQDAWGRPGLGQVAVKWSSASWLTPGVSIPVLYSPNEHALFGAYVHNVGMVLGLRRS
ncbi:MAG: hypothetical protein R3B70_47885 [Polyangiaceae bacterium]